jgi:O-antigen/teichoic acid export membrane protein
MEKVDLKKASITGMFYRFAESTLAQIVSLIVTIVLARILSPENYGTISLVTIFITICNVFVTDGLSSSLIQKKDADEKDFSTIFWASMGLSGILYLVVWLLAPAIGHFYGLTELVLIMRVMGLRIPLAALNSVQSAYISKNLQFKKFFWATLTGTLISGIVGIVMALYGCGTWALVAQYITNSFIDTIFLCVVVDWRPLLCFSGKRFQELFSFGWKILVSALVTEIYDQLRSLIIGKKYTTTDLSYYTKGKQFPAIIGNNIASAVNNVMFPVFSLKQGEETDFKRMAKQSLSGLAYILCPLMIGLFVVSESFVSVILTDKWQAVVPYIRIFCIMYIFNPLKSVNKSAIKALKRSDLNLYLNIAEKVIGIVILIITMKFGPLYIALGATVTYIISAVIFMVASSKLMMYSFKEQCLDIIPHFVRAFVSCAPVWFLGYLQFNDILKLILQVFISIIIYITISKVTNCKDFLLIINSIDSRKRG